MGSKKRKAKKRLLQRESNQHQEEEMCALEAIYGEYYKPHDDFQGFNLKIVPHPGQLETNLVSIVLYVRYPNDYPSKPLYLQIHDAEGNSQEDLTQDLLPLLNDCARHHGANQEVCVYQLVDRCQEYLQQLNEEAIALANNASDSSQEQSLWHQMQQRDADTEAGENSPSGLEGSNCIRLSDLEGLDLSSQGLGEDLFGDDDEEDNASVLPTLTVTRALDSKALRPSGSRGSPSLLHKGVSKDGKAAGSAAAGRAPGSATGAAHSPLPSPSTPPPPDIANQVAIHGELGSPAAPEAGATGPAASPAPAEKSLSKTLPRVMRHLFFGDSGSGGSSNGSASSSRHAESDSEPETSEEQTARSAGMDDSGDREHAAFADAGPSSTKPLEKKLGVAVGGQQRVRRRRRVTGVMRDIGTEIRAGMLLGHLLVRAAAMEEPGVSLSGHCLALLVSHLSGLGLLPHWLGWLLGSHPDLFDPAFQRMFGQALDSGELAEAADPAADKLLKHFWSRQPSPPSTPSAHTQQQAQQQEPTMSRYRSDFEELFKLGQGGFGLVVAASNRLDGRQYAIKKIRLHTRLPRAYARIMREVATLSRLQHPNVVRYFQAWCEPLEEGADERELEEDGGEWGSSYDGSEESSSSGPSHNPRRRKSGSSQWNRYGIDTSSLAPVQENSDEDLFAWDEASHTTAAAATTTTEEQAVTGHSSSSSGAVAAQMLYIQMEFCPRTLSKMIEEGNMSEEQAWGVVRGILTGLAYIHSQGVIHRDLKPANIFYDARGEVKLGDFGLAKFSPAGGTPDPTAQAGDVAAAAATAALSSAAPSDKTGIIGTGYYISPEIANGWASYNEKVDLYSLGVVVYELFHTFSTAMERAVLLRELRELGRLPEEWEAKHPQQARLIRWLMQPSPAERPSAQEVLRSDLLPVRVEDEQVNDLLRSLPDHRATYLRVVDQLFAMHSVSAPAAPAAPGSSLAPAHKQPTPAPEIKLKWDVPGTPVSTSGEAKALVLRTVRGVFSGLGAVEMNSSEIGCVPVNPPENAARMLTSDGEMVALRYEMRSSFARWLAAQQTLTRGAATAGSGPFERGEGMQRYEIGHVHRIKRGRGLPNSYLSADLDVITPAYGKDTGTVPAEKMVADAEVIKATCQILESLPELGGYEVRLGHRQLLEVSVSSLGLSKDVKQLVLSQLRAASAVSPNQPAAREASWPNIRTSLDDLGVPVEAALRCRQLLLNLPGVAEDVMHKARSYLGGLSLTKAAALQLAAALDELEALISHLRTLGLARQAILLDPLLKPDADYFKGAIFQVHIFPASGVSSLILATGGRYDSLLQRLWPAAALPSPGAVGVTLNVERLCLLLGKQLSSAPGNAPCPPCQVDVVVGSRGGGSGLLSQRLSLVGKLRSAGVKAELLRRSCPSFTEQYELATNRAAKWLIILEPSRLDAAGMVKVKHVDKRGAEEEWPLCDVVKNIKLLQTTSGSGRHSQSHLMPTQHLPITPEADLAEPIVGSLEKRHDSWVARRKGHFK